jgi:hypothetical protein
MASPFAPLLAAAIDGRTHNIYYRQHQLEALHQALLDHSSEIKQAIAADTDHTSSEIAIEIHLALSSLKTSYETLQPTKSLADEYLIASGKNAPENRVPVGIAYIEPCTHTLLYSVVAPLSAAIAAGDCVIVLVSPTSPTLTSNLSKLIYSQCTARKHPPHPNPHPPLFTPVRSTPRHLRPSLLSDPRLRDPQLSSHNRPEQLRALAESECPRLAFAQPSFRGRGPHSGS